MARPLTELSRMQKHQLKTINKDELIESILAYQEPSDSVTKALEDRLSVICTEITDIKQSIVSPESAFNKKISELQMRIDKQDEIIKHQQLFLEHLDRKDRESNVVLLGIPDEGSTLEGATNDGQKLQKIWETIGEEVNHRSHRRLGRLDQHSTRNRPLLVVLDSKTSRDKVLEKAKKLKESGENYNRIYIKKDIHPAVRNEWKRLRDVQKRESEKPENAGCNIYLDTRERKLYRDNVLIDCWNPHPF